MFDIKGKERSIEDVQADKSVKIVDLGPIELDQFTDPISLGMICLHGGHNNPVLRLSR